jgi:hypothetical protein
MELGVRAAGPFATPAAPFAMKLLAISERRPTSRPEKRSGDALDLCRLLVRRFLSMAVGFARDKGVGDGTNRFTATTPCFRLALKLAPAGSIRDCQRTRVHLGDAEMDGHADFRDWKPSSDERPGASTRTGAATASRCDR